MARAALLSASDFDFAISASKLFEVITLHEPIPKKKVHRDSSAAFSQMETTMRRRILDLAACAITAAREIA